MTSEHTSVNVEYHRMFESKMLTGVPTHSKMDPGHTCVIAALEYAVTSLTEDTRTILPNKSGFWVCAFMQKL